VPRRIAFVEQGTMTLYFFGQKEDYSLEVKEQIPFLKTSAYSALDDPSRLPASTTRKPTVTIDHVVRVAEDMLGKKCAYCDFGRERSAIAIFSFLYVKFHLQKDEAFRKVHDAVAASVVEMPAEKQRLIIDQVDRAIGGSEGYPFLPAVCP
jgi:hypothetical protein